MKDKEIEGSKEEKTQLMSETDSDELSVSQSAATDGLDESTLTDEEEEALTTMMRKVTLKDSLVEKLSFFTRRRFCFTKLLAEFEGYPVLDEVLNDATDAIDLCSLKSIFSNFGLSLECGTCQLRSEVSVLVMLVCSPKVVVVHKIERSGYHLHVTDVHFSRKKRPNHFLPVNESAFFWVDEAEDTMVLEKFMYFPALVFASYVLLFLIVLILKCFDQPTSDLPQILGFSAFTYIRDIFNSGDLSMALWIGFAEFSSYSFWAFILMLVSMVSKSYNNVNEYDSMKKWIKAVREKALSKSPLCRYLQVFIEAFSQRDPELDKCYLILYSKYSPAPVPPCLALDGILQLFDWTLTVIHAVEKSETGEATTKKERAYCLQLHLNKSTSVFLLIKEYIDLSSVVWLDDFLKNAKSEDFYFEAVNIKAHVEADGQHLHFDLDNPQMIENKNIRRILNIKF
jgi:hypothetical protein